MRTQVNSNQTVGSKDADTKPAFFRRGILTKLLCLLALLIIVPMEVQAIGIDGNVQGFGEGYSTGYNLSFDIQVDKHTQTPIVGASGFLFYDKTGDIISVGLIVDLMINDNTYGDTRDSSWGAIDHFLIGGGGGSSLEGSDKWEIKNLMVAGVGGDLDIKLDYIHQSGDKNTGATFDTRIEKADQDGTDFTSAIAFESSLNYNRLNVTDAENLYFGSKDDDLPANGGPIDSPTDPSAVGWISEIMYEFSLDESAFNGTFDLTAFLANLGTLHMSPNKIGKNMVFPIIGNQITTTAPVPEPATIALLGIGLAGLAGAEVRRRRKNKAVDNS